MKGMDFCGPDPVVMQQFGPVSEAIKNVIHESNVDGRWDKQEFGKHNFLKLLKWSKIHSSERPLA